jgi:hypothetical protein
LPAISNETREGAAVPDDQIVSLARDQQSDRQQRAAGKAELRPAHRALGRRCERAEQLQVDAVAHHLDARGRHIQRDQLVFQRLADGHETGSAPRGPLDHPARLAIAGDQRQVGSACGDHDRLAERAPDHRGGDAVRVEVVRIDQVEVVAVADDALERGLRGEREQRRRDRHSDLRQQWVARVTMSRPPRSSLPATRANAP